jgi:hypothetical protein
VELPSSRLRSSCKRKSGGRRCCSKVRAGGHVRGSLQMPRDKLELCIETRDDGASCPRRLQTNKSMKRTSNTVRSQTAISCAFQASIHRDLLPPSPGPAPIWFFHIFLGLKTMHAPPAQLTPSLTACTLESNRWLDRQRLRPTTTNHCKSFRA